jgi:hypothetical protein
MNLSLSPTLSLARTALLVAAASFGSTAWSQSEIEVFSELGDSFTMYLNQVQMNDAPAPRVLAEVEPGYYQLRIDFEDATKPDILKNNFGVEMGMRSTGKITLNRKGEWVVRPFGYVPISSSGTGNFAGQPSTSPPSSLPSQTTPQQASEGTTESFGFHMSVTGTDLDQNAGQGTGQGTISGNVAQHQTTLHDGQHGESVQMNMSVGGGLVPGGVTMNVNVTTTGSLDPGSQSTTHHAVQHTNHTSTQTWGSASMETTSVAPEAAPEVQGMSDLDFGDYLAAIQAKSFEDSKLSTAKAPLNAGAMLTASQIAQVMKAFTFESSRVEFAIFAHSHCVDAHNYYKTHGAFDFELSIDELNDAIGN